MYQLKVKPAFFLINFISMFLVDKKVVTTVLKLFLFQNYFTILKVVSTLYFTIKNIFNYKTVMVSHQHKIT